MKTKMKTLHPKGTDDIDKKQDDVVEMNIINGLIYFVSHLPACLAAILLMIFSKDMEKFCSWKYSCDLINEIAKFFCVISMFAQFFVFFRFNKNFKKSFHDMKNRFFTK
jgi:hypothetical protein